MNLLEKYNHFLFLLLQIKAIFPAKIFFYVLESYLLGPKLQIT
jgi:hypothetical protein